MKAPLKWLREYTPLDLPAVDLAHRLTIAGIECEATGAPAGGRPLVDWKNIQIGRIVAIKPHPNADRLRLVDVDLGKEQATVVCGAPNLTPGDKVPFARLGAELIDAHKGGTFRLKRADIRGVPSDGMICSERELGISDEHEGIMVLGADAPVGAALADYLGPPGRTVLQAEVTANRPDCLSVIGIAREAAALTGSTVRLPAASYEECPTPIGKLVSVEIEDDSLCKRYCATLIEGVKIGPSPAWMQERLQACDMRPINNIVDITNYVMLEYGQPLHAFDYDKLAGHKIVVRPARAGESMTTLDGVERKLTADTLVIADAASPVALAGVMGGADSEVTPGTTRILLESANFNYVSIRRTSRRLALRSEASLRFERNISPELTVPAVRRATQLIVELAGGKAASGVIDVYPGRLEKKPIRLYAREVKRILGMDIEPAEAKRLLESLGFECLEQPDASLDVTAPYWRMDINQQADLIEDIARIKGYDKVPTTVLSGPLPARMPDPMLTVREKARDILVGCGLQEIITYSLISAANAGGSTLKVFNTLTVEQEYLRPSLRPGVLSALAANWRHEEEGLRLFEIGRVFLARPDDLPEEREMLVAAFSGPRTGSSWRGPPQAGGNMDFYDAKGVLETLFERLGIAACFTPCAEAGLHPGRTAAVEVDGVHAGVVGELHPAEAERLELVGCPVALIELDLAVLLPRVGERKRFESVPRFPSSTRDLALLADASVPAIQIRQTIESFPLVTHVTLFDVYAGGQVPAGKRSLAFRVVYQSPARTLTQVEVDATEREILAKLNKELGVILRS